MRSIAFSSLLGCMLLLSCSTANAQRATAAVNALEKWKSRAVVQDANYVGAAVSVDPRVDGEIRLKLAVGARLDRSISNLITVIAQSVNTVGDKTTVVGEPARLRTALARPDDGSNEILISPQIVLPDSPAANAVRVSVYGLDSDPSKALTMIVPIGATESVAVIGHAGN